MRKLLSALCILSMMFLFSCSYLETKVLPKAKIVAGEKITQAIVKEGQCANIEAVKQDVFALLKVESDESVVVKALAPDEEVSETQPLASSSIGSSICKSAAGVAIPALLKKGVPEAWGCTLSNLTSKVDLLAQKACEKL